jgi:hypothetical protein
LETVFERLRLAARVDSQSKGITAQPAALPSQSLLSKLFLAMAVEWNSSAEQKIGLYVS